MDEKPIHVSGSSAKSLWQEYRLFNDRIEFHTLFGTMTVPFAHVERVYVNNSDVKLTPGTPGTSRGFSTGFGG